MLISTLYLRRTGDDPEAQILLNRLRSEGFHALNGVLIERVFRLEGITQNQALSLKPLFCHSTAETLSEHTLLDGSKGPVIEVGYQRAVTDPELPSVLRGTRAMGIENLSWVRIAHRYQFLGVDESAAKQIVTRYLYNPQVQVIITPKDRWTTLKPQGQAGPVEKIPLKGLDRRQLLRLSDERRLFLDADQMEALQKISDKIERPLTDAELEMFAQTWSDHCFHTTWKSLGLLQALWQATNEINHPLVLSVFEDNAGAVEFYDGWALTIKGETHNSPTAVSPYGGIMTKHGGVIRDTLGCGQGAWPIGGSTIMGLGDPRMEWKDVPKGALHPKTILVESIGGTADYTNPMGIPMMFPVYRFHPGYTGKCFALGHSIGLIPAKRARKGRPKSGDFAILVGGLTGRDGLHGATVSSGSMTSETATVDAAHVQIGQPIEERKFMEAIPALRDADCLRAVTDLGAAGLSSAAGEMGSETGIWINLTWVPLKTEGMHPWEIWISESQERMLLCVPPDKIDGALTILDKYEVPAAIIGKFTATRRCQVVFDPSMGRSSEDLPGRPQLSGETVIDLSFEELRKSCPLPDIRVNKPKNKPKPFTPSPLLSEGQWHSAVRAVLGHLNICDQSAAGFQFDKTVQGMIAVGPYGGKNGRMPSDIWASTPIRGKPYGAVAAVGFNPFYGDVNAAAMARLMMLEPISKLIAAGVHLSDIVLCDNFYTPRVTPEIAFGLREMVLACCDLSKALGTPFISGKDSSSGTFISEDGKRLDIPPTLAVLALGRMPDIGKLVPKPWEKIGNRLYIVGPLSLELGGSVYFDTLGQRGCTLPHPSVEALKRFWKVLKPLQEEGIIQSASAVAEGGLIRRLFEMALGSGLGCEIDLSIMKNHLGQSTLEACLFAESIGAILIEIEEKNTHRIETDLDGILLGRIKDEFNIAVKTDSMTVQLPMQDLISAWEKPFREVAG
ncbi:MAG: AIR synthase-related protein [bacterium]